MATHGGARRPLGSVDECLRVIKGRHKADILIRLGRGTRRFGELGRELPRVSERVLARQLQELERDGIVARTVFAEVPPRVEYALTDKGRDLLPIIEDMRAYGQRWLGAECAAAGDVSLVVA